MAGDVEDEEGRGRTEEGEEEDGRAGGQQGIGVMALLSPPSTEEKSQLNQATPSSILPTSSPPTSEERTGSVCGSPGTALPGLEQQGEGGEDCQSCQPSAGHREEEVEMKNTVGKGAMQELKSDFFPTVYLHRTHPSEVVSS